MDNTNYNFHIVETLCNHVASKNDTLFYKPIILLITAIIECILYDFAKRVTEHSQEKIPNIDNESIFDTRSKNLDDLQPLLDHVKKNNLMRINDDDSLYDDLNTLRKMRNRIHIQNKWNSLDKDEYKIWTKQNVQFAGYLLERICEVLCHVYPRPNANFIPMSYFPKPWNSI